ncbi:hypothetical protein BMS3Bbin04_01561 [bacterium BMS3Bbin04]|nr:hypothetical protein BMS3Bbin04_01561 [bacterium BMS3Bbin04]
MVEDDHDHGLWAVNKGYTNFNYHGLKSVVSGYPVNSAMIHAPVTRRLFGGSQGSSNDSTEF